MVEITIELDTSPVGKLTEKWQKARPLGLKYAAQDMTRFLIDNSPVDHGLLRQWSISSIDDEQATITTPAEYAAAQNFGARAHDIFISPKSKSALFWGDYDGKKPIMSKGHTVHIPALAGKHFVEKSIKQTQARIAEFFTINGG